MIDISLDSKVSLKQAYLIMFDYLEAHYERTGKPDEIGALLGQLALWDGPNGKEPMDGAVFPDWLESAAKVLNQEASGGYKDANIRLK
jgi:hypothetical protein